MKGRDSLSRAELRGTIDDASLLRHYLGITSLPCSICSPLRVDRRPSFGISLKGGIVVWRDFSTGEHGDLYTMLSLLWKMPIHETLAKVNGDILSGAVTVEKEKTHPKKATKKVRDMGKGIHEGDMQVCVRDWQEHDIGYWESYGISLKWLKYAEVYPISYKIVIKGGLAIHFKADKYAYAFVERKEGRLTIKVYQPFNKSGYKWASKHDGSVVSLWTKVPKKGERVCICSSLKDALCLWANVGIPSLAVQGEGYSMSVTAVRELRKRFKEVCVLFDNDAAGLANSRRLCKETGFREIILPPFKGGKDISDFYKQKDDKEAFKAEMSELFY